MWPDRICDSAIAVLDKAAERKPMDEKLLQVVDRQALKREITKTVELIQALELERLLSRQSWWYRFSGAELEERLKIEVASQKVSKAFGLLEHLSRDAVRRIELMRAERDGLVASIEVLDNAIDYARELLADGKRDDVFLLERFRSKLANLITIRAANEMAIQQIKLADDSLVALNDRFRQISTVLFPLWQQQLFAILNKPGRLSRRDRNVADFAACHEALERYFIAEARS